MVGRKIQCFEVVIIRLNLWTFLDGIPKIAKHPDHLVHRLDDRMLRAKRTANARESNVDTIVGGFCSCVGLKSGVSSLRAPKGAAFRVGLTQDAIRSRTDYVLHFSFELVDTLSSVTLCILRRCLEPNVVDLGQETVGARHPTVTKYFPFGLAVDRLRLSCKRRQKILCSFLQSSGGEILELGNCVGRFFLRRHIKILTAESRVSSSRDKDHGRTTILNCLSANCQRLVFYAAPPRAPRACAARLLNAAASFTARSARILRSSSTPAFFKPWMNWL